MIADFFTKPLQGSLFKKLRDTVLGYTTIEDLIKERLEKMGQERVRPVENTVSISPKIQPAPDNRDVGTRKNIVTWADIVRTRKVGKGVKRNKRMSNSHSFVSIPKV